MTHKPIEDYGIIGNMRTAALVSRSGSIDWYCFPQFDSPSVFAALLDDKVGGRFSITSTSPHAHIKQLYWPDTNVLVTRFLCPDGVGEVQDFMPVSGGGPTPNGIVRRVRMTRGQMQFRMVCDPSFDYARQAHELAVEERRAIFESQGTSLALMSTVALKRQGTSAVAHFTLGEREDAVFLLQGAQGLVDRGDLLAQQCGEWFDQTVQFWRRWLAQSRYAGRWRDVVDRAALTLKLLTFEPTGAIIAAPTCSLPEKIGGARNWDYRYTWIRDAAFSLYGLLRLGFTSEASAFMGFLDARFREAHDQQRKGRKKSPIQVLYGIDGRHETPEFTLDHLGGYKDSRPVRVGNEAYKQFQLDVYGELMDSVYLFNKYGAPISYDAWTHLRSILDWVCDNWQRPDDGIWEVRGGSHEFVYSKLMCWVAIDRGLRLADKRSFPAERSRWLSVRDEIYQAILTRGWSDKRQSFIQSFGSECLDASLLMMPLVFFMAPNDPKMLKTIEAINRSPLEGGLTSDGLVHRYDVDCAPDGVFGDEGTFNMCSFWLVEALTRAGRLDAKKLDEARLLFERMLGYANHLGLFSEETGPSGEALGNFPQAFTHLSLISAAFNLDRSLSTRQ